MISTKKLAEEFNLDIIGPKNREINGVTSLDSQSENLLTWVKSDKYTSKIKKGIILIHNSIPLPDISDVTFLISKNSVKIDFSKIAQKYFTPPVDIYLVNEVDKHRKNKCIKIGDNVFIGSNVIIGDDTVVFPNSVIEAYTIVGKCCVVKSHVSIGTEGLGLELNPETNLLEKFPQLGKVIIEDYVEIGPNSTVRRGSLKNTIIRRGCKIGSLVNIGHNCEIGENCILTSGIIIAGSSSIGKNVFIGVGASVRNAISIGDDAMIGIGAVVIKNVQENTTIVGNPGKVLS